MAQIIESIPNISEGRRPEVIEACVDQIRTTPGCTLLNYSSDESHNRTVITYIGDAKGVEEASVHRLSSGIRQDHMLCIRCT